MRCAVYKCETKCGNKESQSFRFPKIQSVAKKWMQFCRRPDKDNFNFEKAHVCINHFHESDFMNKMQYDMGFCKLLRLKHDAVPHIYKDKDTSNGQDLVHVAPVYVEEQVILNMDGVEQVSSDAVIYNNLENGQQDASKVEIERLNQEIRTLRREKLRIKNELQREKTHMKNMQDKLEAIFSAAQIDKLKGENCANQNWNVEDISKSMQLHSLGAKTYEFFLENNFPVPSVETLQSFAQKIDISPGIIRPVVRVLASAAGDLKDTQKLCILSFDEMILSTEYCYDSSSESTLALHNTVQVAMLRGLKSEWKQPIFFDFDRSMSPYMLNTILSQSKKCGYIIVAIVSDMHASNRFLHHQLKVKTEEPWFNFDGRKIFAFADVPNLMCSLGTHFLKSGFLIEGKSVNRDIIDKLLSITPSSELSITHKICLSDLKIDDGECNLTVSAKLFSKTISQAIEKAASLGYLQERNWQECQKLFHLTNDWFDVLNSRVAKNVSQKRMSGYGLDLEFQNKILDDMSSLVKEMRVIGHDNLLPFQKGIIQTSKALKLLLVDIKSRYNAKYILTNRLNINNLENLFDNIRFKEEMNEEINQQEFQCGLRSYIIRHNEFTSLFTQKDMEIIESTENVTDYEIVPAVVEEVSNCNEDFASFICDILEEDQPENIVTNWEVHIN